MEVKPSPRIPANCESVTTSHRRLLSPLPTVKLSQRVRQPQSSGILNFRKALTVDLNVIGKGHRLFAEESTDTARSVRDLKDGSILLVGCARGMIVLALATKEGVSTVRASDLGDLKRDSV